LRSGDPAAEILERPPPLARSVAVGRSSGGDPEKEALVTAPGRTGSIGISLRGKKGPPVKKLLLLMLVLAIGAAVAYKVREA
jgi:hypothetical protein